MANIRVAIDGPAGAGKSTVSREVARQLGYVYLDSGAMYRAVAFAAVSRGVSLDDADALTDLANQVHISFNQDVPPAVFLDGTDVSTKIRTPELGTAASMVSQVSGVRVAMVKQQQALGKSDNIVMEGRDIGTVVFPDAEVKVYLTATVEERARRRAGELHAAGQTVAIDEIARQIAERDFRDMNRDDSPLRVADGAWELVTDCIGISDVITLIVDRVKAFMPAG
ncbi:MAG: (d)CMP kinase [Armatimonadota bacterium]